MMNSFHLTSLIWFSLDKQHRKTLIKKFPKDAGYVSRYMNHHLDDVLVNITGYIEGIDE